MDKDLPTEAEDFWTVMGDYLMRQHKQPRETLYLPTEAESPIPLRFLNILRTTETDLEHIYEAKIEDYWTEDGAPSLSSPWTGKTMFTLLRPDPPAGMKWAAGRLTRIQATTRPDSIWPEIWTSLSKKNKQIEIDKWSKENAEGEEARRKQGISKVEEEETDEFCKILAKAKQNHSCLMPRPCQRFPSR